MKMIKLYRPAVIIPENILIGPVKNFMTPTRTIHMVQISDATNPHLLLATEVFYSHRGILREEGVIAYSPNGLATCALTRLEQQVAQCLQMWASNTPCQELPSWLMDALKADNLTLCPTAPAGRTTWFKLAVDCNLYNWAGDMRNDHLKSNIGKSTGPGYYQLLLRPISTYVGPHNVGNHVASLHIRVAQIRYLPTLDEQVQRKTTKCLLKDEL